ncbi:MAG: hypothetical protein LBH96_02405 [Candidatus Peribacteria bacterium]|jgi:peptidyl-tRNA hydrolase|nr:hypothetical protein [Candidatus Peribacteria bacterium]
MKKFQGKIIDAEMENPDMALMKNDNFVNNAGLRASKTVAENRMRYNQ